MNSQKLQEDVREIPCGRIQANTAGFHLFTVFVLTPPLPAILFHPEPLSGQRPLTQQSRPLRATAKTPPAGRARYYFSFLLSNEIIWEIL